MDESEKHDFHKDTIIVDSDTHFTINTTTRSITNTESKKKSLIQYDHNSERFSFDIDRIIEGHDVLDCNRIQIHYINASSNGNTKESYVYPVDDIKVHPDDNNKACFTWLISKNATQFSGLLTFLISFECVDVDNVNVLYRWNSAIYSAITIASGMDNDEVAPEVYADALLKLEAELKNTVIPKEVEECYINTNFATSDEVAHIFNIALNDLMDIESASEMDSLLISDNVGKTYRYVGKSTENYINGDLYEVVEVVDVIANQTEDTVNINNEEEGLEVRYDFKHYSGTNTPNVSKGLPILYGSNFENDFYNLSEISNGEYVVSGFTSNVPSQLSSVSFVLKVQTTEPQQKEFSVIYGDTFFVVTYNPRGNGWGFWKGVKLEQSNQGSLILFTELDLTEEVGGTITASQSDFGTQTPKQYDCVIGANGYMGQITNSIDPYIIETKLKIKGEKGENGSDGADAPKPVYSAITIPASSWVADTTKEPFTYKATVSLNLSLNDNSTVELVNNNPSLFMEYAFSIFDDSVTSTSITVYSIGKPTEGITLKVGVTE